MDTTYNKLEENDNEKNPKNTALIQMQDPIRTQLQ